MFPHSQYHKATPGLIPLRHHQLRAYSPDLATSNFHLLTIVKSFIAGKKTWKGKYQTMDNITIGKERGNSYQKK